LPPYFVATTTGTSATHDGSATGPTFIPAFAP
jgi:hypothetical protein